MKKQFRLSSIMVLLFCSACLFAQNVGITDKTGGITPANTLHVHKNANTGNVLQVTAGATGETATDGLVIKRDASAFGIINQENDTINLGGSTATGSHTSFETDGTMVFKGGATVWDDIMVYPDATGRGSSTPPVWELFKTNGSGSQGVWLYWFSSTTEQEVYFTVQIPHSYKVGTALYPHVHWTTKTGTPSGTDVVWGLEYTWMSIGGTFGNTTLTTGNSVIPPIGTPSGTTQHLITSLGTITGTTQGISTIITCRLYRASTDSRDTFGNTIGLLGFDIHFEKDTEGSRSEFTK